MPIELDEIVLKPDGSAVHRTYQEHPCNVVDKIAEAMSENAVRIIKRAGEIDKNPYHLIVTGKETYAVMPIPSLVLNTCFKMDSDKLMRPDFADRSGENPTLPIRWPAPTGMKLVFAARIYFDSTTYMTRPKESCYLLALDKSLNSYMLPLPNLYTTGYLCMGDFQGLAVTLHGAFELAFRQLMQSKWNSDLYDDARRKSVQKMMAFKPDGDQFIPQDYAGWTSILGRVEGVAIELMKGALR